MTNEGTPPAADDGAADAAGAAPTPVEDFRPQTFQPSRKDRLKPLELLLMSGGASLFVGIIVLASTREIVLSAVFFGIVFIVVLVALAMFSLTFKPDDAEIADIDEQNRGAHG